MLKYNYHSSFNSEQNLCVCGEDLYDDLTGTGFCTLIMDKTFIGAPEIIRKVSTP